MTRRHGPARRVAPKAVSARTPTAIPGDPNAAIEAARDGRMEAALTLMFRTAAIRALPPPQRRVAAGLALGDLLFRGGWYQAAEAAAAEILRLRPDHGQAALLRARALFCTDDLAGALAAAQDAVRLAPADMEAALQLVTIAIDLGRGDWAEAEARAFARRVPAGPHGDTLCGLVARRLGRPDEAVWLLRRVAVHHLPARLLLAHTLHDLGSNDEAAETYRQVLRQEPAHEEAWFGLSNTLADQGLMGEAAAIYGRAARTIAGFNQRWPDFLLPPDLLAAPSSPLPAVTQGGLVMSLGYVPFEMPALPLSLAALKGFVEHHSPHRIGIVDLNARFFQAVRRALAAGAAPMALRDNDGFLAATALLSTDGPDFFDPRRYETAAAAYLEGVSVLKTVFGRQCRQLRQWDGPIPWHARALARALLVGNPAIVGLSAMFDGQLAMTHLLARAVKSLAPNVVVVVGGGAIARPNLEALLASSAIDYAVLHDGEETLLGLLDALAAGETRPALPGLFHRGGDGALVSAGEAAPVRQERVPPADFSGLDFAAYASPRPVLPVLTSRGCYWRRCTFCNHFAAYAGSYKAQNVDRVVDELEHHVRRTGIRHFTLVDEMISASRFRKIGEAIIARGLDVTYYALAKPTADFTPEILAVMARSGCRFILWGQESGSERMLAMMDKGNTVASSRATLRAAAAVGIRNHLFLMVGYPTETLEDLGDTVRLLCDEAAAIDQTQSGPFVLEKGTPLHSNPERYGIARIFDRRSEGACQIVRFEPRSGLSPAQAVIAESVLRAGLFSRFNPFSRLLGDFRDHALIVYSDLPRPDIRASAPSAETLMGEVVAALDMDAARSLPLGPEAAA